MFSTSKCNEAKLILSLTSTDLLIIQKDSLYEGQQCVHIEEKIL